MRRSKDLNRNEIIRIRKIQGVQSKKTISRNTMEY